MPSLRRVLDALHAYADPHSATSSEEQAAAMALRQEIARHNTEADAAAAPAADAGAGTSPKKKKAKAKKHAKKRVKK